MAATGKWIVWSTLMMLVLGAAGSALGAVVHIGNVKLDLASSIRATEKGRGPGPITMKTRVRTGTDDGTPAPPIRGLELLVDKRISLAPDRGRSCSRGQLVNALPRTALRKCRRALVGRGSTRAIVDYPDQRPFTTRGKILVFRGSSKTGPGSLLVHSYYKKPAVTVAISPAPIHHLSDPQFSDRITVRVPEISGGHGELTELRLTLGDGSRFLTARCGGSFVVGVRLRLEGMDPVDPSTAVPCRRR